MVGLPICERSRVAGIGAAMKAETTASESPMTEETVPDLYRLAFMPGCFRCPLCDFHLTKSVMSFATGQIGTTENERQSEPCPNDGTIMVHVTYREQVEAYSIRLKEEFDNIDRLRATNKALTEALGKAEEALERLGVGHWEAVTRNTFERANNEQWGEFFDRGLAEAAAVARAKEHNDTALFGYAVFVHDISGDEATKIMCVALAALRSAKGQING